MGLKGVGRAIWAFTKNNASTILTYTGIGGMITAGVIAVVETPKALKRLENAEYDKGAPLTRWEKTKVLAPVFGPPIAIATASAVGIATANHLNLKKQAAMVGVIESSQLAAREFKRITEETVEPKVMEEIRQKVAEKRAEDAAQEPAKCFDYIPTGKGNVRCLETATGIRFLSSQIAIDDARNEINQMMLHGEDPTLQDFLEFLNVDITSKLARNFEWCYNDLNSLIDIRTNYTKDFDGEPVLVIEYSPDPEYNSFRNW